MNRFDIDTRSMLFQLTFSTKQTRRRLQATAQAQVPSPSSWIAGAMCCVYLWVAPLALCYNLVRASKSLPVSSHARYVRRQWNCTHAAKARITIISLFLPSSMNLTGSFLETFFLGWAMVSLVLTILLREDALR